MVMVHEETLSPDSYDVTQPVRTSASATTTVDAKEASCEIDFDGEGHIDFKDNVEGSVSEVRTQIFVPCPTIQDDDDETFITEVRPGRKLWRRTITLRKNPLSTQQTHGTLHSILRSTTNKQSLEKEPNDCVAVTDIYSSKGGSDANVAREKRQPPVGGRQSNDPYVSNRHEMDQNNEGNASNAKEVALLFVHGSCAASQQFDALVDAFGDQLKRGVQPDDTELFMGATQENGKVDENYVHAAVNIDVLRCHMFDALGCGNSRPDPFSDRDVNWSDYSSTALLLDLEFIYRSIISALDDSTPLFIVSHSYGTSQVLQLLNSLRKYTENDTRMVGGVIFISGALKDCPNAPSTTRDGGHMVFSMPLTALKVMKSSMTEAFIEQAYVSSNLTEKQKEEKIQFSLQNNMKMCQAFYRQQRYATSKDARCAVLLSRDEDISRGHDHETVAGLSGASLESTTLVDKEFMKQDFLDPKLLQSNGDNEAISGSKSGHVEEKKDASCETRNLDQPMVDKEEQKSDKDRLTANLPHEDNEAIKRHVLQDQQSIVSQDFDDYEERSLRDANTHCLIYQTICPSLVIHGQEDNVFPLDPVGLHFASSVPSSTLVQVPNTSHQVFEERPRQVAACILNFISKSLEEHVMTAI